MLQEAALGALLGGDSDVQDLKRFIQTNHDILIKELMEIPALKLTKPLGTFYCFPDFNGINPNSQELATHLLEKAYVSTVPGIAFGKDGFLRLSYTCSTAQIIESAARIRWAVDPASPDEIIINGEKHQRDWEI